MFIKVHKNSKLGDKINGRALLPTYLFFINKSPWLGKVKRAYLAYLFLGINLIASSAKTCLEKIFQASISSHAAYSDCYWKHPAQLSSVEKERLGIASKKSNSNRRVREIWDLSWSCQKKMCRRSISAAAPQCRRRHRRYATPRCCRGCHRGWARQLRRSGRR